MESTTVVSPDALVLETLDIPQVNTENGKLTANLNRQLQGDEPELQSLLKYPKGKVSVLLTNLNKSDSNKATLLIPALPKYIALHLSKKSHSEAQVEKLIKNWQSYFLACQQLLLNFPEMFSASDILIPELSELHDTISLATLSDESLLALHEDWLTFVITEDDNAPTSTYVIASAGKQFINSTKKDQGLNKLKTELRAQEEKTKQTEQVSEANESQLIEIKNEIELMMLQISQLQEELETQFEKTKLAEKTAQEKENRLTESKSENELMLLQITQLQEELEHYFIEFNKATAQANKSKVKWPKYPKNHVSLVQNSVSEHQEQLTVRIRNLHIENIVYPLYDLTIQANRVQPDSFTKSGSLELRVQPGKREPLVEWTPNAKDKWGKKLLLELPHFLNKEQQENLDAVSSRNKVFMRSLFHVIVKNIQNIDMNNVALNRPITHWHGLINQMSGKLNEA
jgi:hypothetical protein